MSLVKTLNDVRKMRRSLKLRGETDPDVVATSLEAILRESIALRAADANGKLGKGATNELRNIRSDLVAQQLDAGKRTPELIGKFSLILDEMDDIDKQAKEVSKGSNVSEKSAEGLKNTFSSITNSIPSAETITSALITANPILGYGSKMIVDLVRSKKEQNKKFKEERQIRLQQLKEREALLEQQLENVEKESNQLDQDSERNLDDVNQDTLVSILAEVRDEIKQLNAIWTDGDSPIHEQTESLEQIVEESKETNRLEQLRTREQEIDERTAALEGRGDVTEGFLSLGGEGDGGINLNAFGLGGLATRAGALGGAVAGMVSSLLTPFLGVLTFFKTGASFLGKFAKFAARGTLITGVFMGLFDFVDSFLNASEVLGKEVDEVDFKERLGVGFAGLIHGLLTPLDWIAGFFDANFLEEDKKESTKNIYDAMSGWRQDAEDWMVGLFEEYDDFETGVPLLDGEFLPKRLWDTMAGWRQSAEDWMVKFFENNDENVFTDPESTLKADLSHAFDEMISDISDFVGNVVDWINDAFWGSVDSVGGWLGSAVDFFTGSGSDNLSDQIDRGTRDVRDSLTTMNESIVTDEQWEQVGLSSSPLERASQRMEDLTGQSYMENNVNITPMSNVTNNNVKNTTIKPSVGSSSNTDPTLSRFRFGSDRYAW